MTFKNKTLLLLGATKHNLKKDLFVQRKAICLHRILYRFITNPEQRKYRSKMSVRTKNRKRARSVSNEGILIQNKVFINQQMIDQNDANKMKEIHGEFDYNKTSPNNGQLAFLIKLSIRRQNHKTTLQKCQQQSTKWHRRTQSRVE